MSYFPRESDSCTVPEFPRLEYTKGDVRRAGQALATDLIWTDETAETIRHVVRIANNWRDSKILRATAAVI